MTDDIDPLHFLIQESRTNFAAFVSLLHRPRFKHSGFSVEVCKAIDIFVDDVIAGKRPVLMLTAPPQHGKSSLVSRCLPPYLFGRLHGYLPAVRIAGASYALALSRRNTRDARSIMGEPLYREVFPDVSLIGFKGVDNADGFDVPNGGLRGVGVGGSLTGFSVDCFAPNTKMLTDAGLIEIQNLHTHAKTVKVLSYDHQGRLEYARIKAIGHRKATRLYRITTNTGRVLEVTGNHPVYANGCYTAADKLSPGDILLCALSTTNYTNCGRLSETDNKIDIRRVVLQQNVHGRRETEPDAVLFRLWRKSKLAWCAALRNLPQTTFKSDNTSKKRRTRDHLPRVRKNIYKSLEGGSCPNLWTCLRREFAFRKNGGCKKPSIQRIARNQFPQGIAPQQSGLALCTFGDIGSRRTPMQAVFFDKKVASAPHRREPFSQFVFEFIDTVRNLPSGGSQLAAGHCVENDFVRSVEVVDRPVNVYDIQVEKNANVFANGILAHNCALIDDATRDAQAALSPVVQDGLEAWYESVLMTRLQARSGTVIIGTPWSANDLLARVRRKMEKDQRFTLLSFPALNLPSEIGYNPDLPEGALVPHLHDETKLREMKKHMSEFWWSAMFQQVPLSEFGAIFKKQYLQYYRRAELPATFHRLVISVDATFKDGQASDFVCAGVWGFTQNDQRAWLLDFRRAKLAFMATAQAITDLKQKHPRVSRIYIEDAANGAALVDMLRKHFTGLEGVPPLGSKEARAAAVSWAWENGQVMLPHPDEVPGITPLVAEITTFPDTTTGHDDAVDMMTIALHQLMLRSPIASMITKDILNRV